MLTIYIQKVLDTAEGESQIGLSMGQYADHLLDTETAGRCWRGESSVKGGGMLTIYIQKVLDTAEGKCPAGQGAVC